MHSPTRRRLAALAATAVTATAAVGLAAAPAAAQPSAFPVVDGSIDWSVKESFRNYLLSPIAHGEITTGGGASVNDDGTYGFPVTDGNYDMGTHNVTAQSEGSVHFWGHGGELDLLFSDIRVETDHASGTGVLYLDVTDPDGTVEDVPFADLDFSDRSWDRGESTTATDVPAVLTAAGADAFAGFYSEGEALDPVTIAIKLGQPDTGGEETETPGEEPSEGEDPETTAPTEPEAPEGLLEIVDGRADWGVKESFRKYVTGPIAHGDITASDGAEQHSEGLFRFTEATGAFDTETGELDASFSGAVRFTGHDGELDLTITGLAVRGTGEDLSLYVGDTELAELDDVELGVVDGGLAVSGLAAVLTESGAEFFTGNVHGNETRFYEAGDAVDPVSFALAFDEDVDLGAIVPGGNGGGSGDGAGPGGPKLPTTGAGLTWVLAAALALLAAGVGVLIMARRRTLAS